MKLNGEGRSPAGVRPSFHCEWFAAAPPKCRGNRRCRCSERVLDHAASRGAFLLTRCVSEVVQSLAKIRSRRPCRVGGSFVFHAIACASALPRRGDDSRATGQAMIERFAPRCPICGLRCGGLRLILEEGTKHLSVPLLTASTRCLLHLGRGCEQHLRPRFLSHGCSGPRKPHDVPLLAHLPMTGMSLALSRHSLRE